MSHPLPDLDALLAHGDFVRALARSLVADPDRADDIVQQTWMASIERPPIPGLPARAWLASVVRNAARHVVRSDRRRRRAEANLTPRPPAPSTADVVAREAIRAAIVRAVLDLAEPYREAVLLRYFEGLPPRAIARQLRVPVETVRTRLKRAHALLREHLDREHGDRRAWVLTVLPLARLGAPTGGLASASPIIIIVLVGLVAALLAMLQWGVLPIAPGIGPPSTSDGSIIGGPAGFSTHPTDATASSDRGPTTPPTVRRPTITGHLVDRGGRPVPGASVRSFPSTATSLFETTGPGVPFTDSTESDEQGRFTVALDPTEPFGAIFVEKSGFSPAAVGELRPADDVVVTLDSPWTLTGTVRDGDDRPVAGARVRWRRILLLCRIERVAQSDANGTFRLEGLPASEPAAALGDAWAIDVDADGFAPLHVESNPSRLHEPPVEHLDLVLGAGATLSGRVLDDQSGEAIVGAEVSLYSVEGNPMAVSRDTGLVVVEPSFGRKLASVVSGPDGAYRIDHVPARGFHDPSCFLQDDAGSLIAYVRVEAPGVSNRVFPVRVSDEGATVTQDLRCARAATIVGRVVDERGRPVRGATMSARDHFSDHLGVWGSNPGTTTAEDGRYTLERVAASDHVSVHARLGAESASGYVDVAVRAGAVAEAPDIVFGSSLVANLVVVDSGRRPVWGAVAVSGYRMGVETRADEHGRL
ncbi:MAG: sigma-70 family RNA polymerase sigma factor, partial [Planctomycetes bacterium]|nr:sigma-70 family RNA polymerase sigma factor [Planctomycetota bacterium]